MKYLLDFNIITSMYDRSNVYHESVIRNLSSAHGIDKLYVSVLTIFEFEYSFF